MSWLSSIWRNAQESVGKTKRVAKRAVKKPGPYRFLRVDDFPTHLERFKVYVAGTKKYPWAAAMLCPCGCGDIIELNLLHEASPSWTVREHLGGSASIRPSVWRTRGCGSHFVIERGHLYWY